MPNETEKAWMAGFIDGEGSITIRRLSPGHRYSPYFIPIVAVSNTSKSTLRFFSEHYGGGISSNGNAKRHQGWSEGYVWFCPIGSVTPILNDVLPFLRLKQRHALVLREFMGLRRGPLGYGKRLPKSELGERTRLWHMMHKLPHLKGKRTAFA